MFRGTSPNPEAWSDADIEAYARVLDVPARARAQSLLYRTFLARELPAIARGRYRDQSLTVPTLLLFGSRDAFLSAHGLRGYEDHADAMTVESSRERATSSTRSVRSWSPSAPSGSSSTDDDRAPSDLADAGDSLDRRGFCA